MLLSPAKCTSPRRIADRTGACAFHQILRLGTRLIALSECALSACHRHSGFSHLHLCLLFSPHSSSAPLPHRSLCARPALLFPFLPPPPPTLPPPLQDCAETEVDRNKCCTLCNMFFTSAIVAQSHYQGKTHAKRVRLVLGETPSIPAAMASPTNAGTSSPTSPAALTSTPAAADPPLNPAAFKV